MRPNKTQLARDIADFNVRSRAFREAAKTSDFVAVCLIGTTKTIPRDFGDNEGVWPVRVATTTKPKDIAKRADLESPVHKVTIHDLVWTQSDQHAKRLKSQLDTLLLGSSEDNKALRHGWRDVEHDPQLVWPLLLHEALQALGAGFAAFDESERLRRVAKRAHRFR